jgi:elongation factor G
MDRVGADFGRVCQMMVDRLHARPVPVQIPWGVSEGFCGVVDVVRMRALRWEGDALGSQYDVLPVPEELKEQAVAAHEKVVEAACEVDDALLARYLGGEALTPEELIPALRRATLEMRIIPVLCGSAFRNKGVQPLLDSVLDLLPSPLDVPAMEGTDDAGNTVTRPASDDAPFAALVFKIMSDPFVGHLAFVRVYSGRLATGDHVFNTARRQGSRVGRLLKMHANKREEITEVGCGDIAAIVGLRNASTGDTICDSKAPVLLESMTFPEPVIRLAIEPKTKADQERLADGLGKLVQEDPTFRVQTTQTQGRR